MKIRSGFVSNSSSSSFILPLDANTEEVAITISLSDLIKMFDGDETSLEKIVRTEEDLREYILDQYGWHDATIEEIVGDESYIHDIYYDSLRMINEGKIVIFGGVSYHDQGLERILKQLGATISD